MMRRILIATLLAVAAGTVALANQPATFVLNNGERVSGEISYGGGGTIDLNGKSYQLTDIAIVAFQTGDPPATELQQLPATDQPVELERNMVVLRGGSVVKGKLYKFSPTGDSITIDTGIGNRRDISSHQIARVYLNVAHARAVYNDILRAGPVAVATSGVAGNTVHVQANQTWTDTNIVVKKGDKISFHATGQVRIAPGGNDALAGPDGAASDTGARNAYPVAAMPAGGLVARVGNSAAFAIGSNTAPITMPANGRLYLGVNDSNYSDNAGVFTVAISR
jgi:hypothetical protein